DVAGLQAQVLDVRAERMAFDHKVSALKSDMIDPDLLEERARILLGYGYGNEVLVLTPVAPHFPVLIGSVEDKRLGK
ncbi:MAG: hypothetical protein JKY92_10420, partial [Magnetovibrio sp.]|nr:hypothetical protein [Magnetovibrio sp.]